MKKFASSLMAGIGAFLAIPNLIYWGYVAFESFSRRVEFLYIAFIMLFVLALAIFVTETISAIKLSKGKEMGKVYNIITMVLNAVFAVLSLVAFVLIMVDFGEFNLEVYMIMNLYFFTVVLGAAANATAFGFKLHEMLSKK